MESSFILLILCIGVLTYLILMSYFKKKINDEVSRQENTPPNIEYEAKVIGKEIGYKPSIGTVCTIKFLFTSGKQIQLTTGTDIYNNINKLSVGTLKYIDSHIVSFTEN